MVPVGIQYPLISLLQGIAGITAIRSMTTSHTYVHSGIQIQPVCDRIIRFIVQRNFIAFTTNNALTILFIIERKEMVAISGFL